MKIIDEKVSEIIKLTDERETQKRNKDRKEQGETEAIVKG